MTTFLSLIRFFRRIGGRRWSEAESECLFMVLHHPMLYWYASKFHVSFFLAFYIHLIINKGCSRGEGKVIELEERLISYLFSKVNHIVCLLLVEEEENSLEVKIQMGGKNHKFLFQWKAFITP